MSDEMLLAILRCPCEAGDEVSVMELKIAAVKAAEKIETLRAKVERLEAIIDRVKDEVGFPGPSYVDVYRIRLALRDDI